MWFESLKLQISELPHKYSNLNFIKKITDGENISAVQHLEANGNGDISTLSLGSAGMWLSKLPLERR